MRSLIWLAISLAPFTVAQRVSTSGRCGSGFGFTCQGSRWGNCCSQYFYCGQTDAYCGTGCQAGFGTCRGSTLPSAKQSSTLSTKVSSSSARTSPSSSAPSSSPSSTLKVTTNARCGNLYNASPKGMTCQGSRWGNCCSQYGYCGSTSEYCSTGCQSAFGSCNPVKSSSSVSSTKSASSSSNSVASSSSVVSSQASSTPTSSSVVSSSSVDPSSSVVSSSVVSSSVVSSSVVSSSVVSSSSDISSTSVIPSSSASSSTAVSSSSIIASPSADASPSPSSSILPSPTPGCVGVPVANYLVNPQFANRGSIAPGWTSRQASSASYFAGGHPDAYYAVSANGFIEDYKIPSEPILQTVAIPSGTVVSCSAWTKLNQGDGTPKVFEMRIDGVLCASRTDTAVADWQQLTGQPIVLTGESHVVSLQMLQTSTASVVVAGFDDIVVRYVNCGGLIPATPI